MRVADPAVESASPKAMRKKPVLMIVLLVVAALVVSLEFFPSYTYAFHASSAVSFSASLNSTSVHQNQTVRIILTDTNFLPFPNEPPDGGIFRAMNLSSNPCGGLYPFGVAAYEGRYMLANISAAKKTEVFDVFSVYFCPAGIIGEVYRLGPFQTVTRYVDMSGYWTNGLTQHQGGGVSLGVLRPLPGGVYTLVIADAWGHTEILYFKVV
ncbi:MAG TPA: hypothetical protein VGR56_04470 [Nitrososphaerales archaeon]|nr:hypothetical protein [Nitrososphaerales archaeon]